MNPLKNETSSWEYTKRLSSYHFDTTVFDPRWDLLQGIGRFEGDWAEALEQVKKTAEPATWRNRLKGQKYTVSPMIDAEERDLIEAGAPADLVLLRMQHDNIPEIFLKMGNMFDVENAKIRIHVQYPGEVFTQHIDKLNPFSWNPGNVTDDKIRRFIVFLTDWEPGHFYQFGNESVSGWRAGDIHSFAWPHVPHCTANAGMNPRVTLQVTGHPSIQTTAFLRKAANTLAIKI
jgi:hypothetical protein